MQRSPDGGDERTIAKTVSLLLTPEQASKLTLAENLGQVSLIPRNPNDEESAESLEYSTDDLLADSGKNSRKKEQGRNEKEPAPQDNGLLSAIQQNVPPAKPPFIMEIVEAQDVREVKFDPDTGKPLPDQNLGSPGNISATPGMVPSMAPPIPPTSTSTTPDKNDINDSLDDFPVNFN